MYRATRPHPTHVSVTCVRGGGGAIPGSRSIEPEQDGQLSGSPLRSLAIRWRACAGLYELGLGFRIRSPSVCLSGPTRWPLRRCCCPKLNPKGRKSKQDNSLRVKGGEKTTRSNLPNRANSLPDGYFLKRSRSSGPKPKTAELLPKDSPPQSRQSDLRGRFCVLSALSCVSAVFGRSIRARGPADNFHAAACRPQTEFSIRN